MGRLENKVALITGAGGGIGSTSALRFAQEGAAVVVNDTDEARATRLVDQIRQQGGQALLAIADISSSRAVRAMLEATEQKFGGLDILVNNAFRSVNDRTITQVDEEDWDATIAVTLKGPFLCTKYAIPLMQARGGGSIVSISSVNALFGVGETAYTAAKGGLISMMRLVAAEYGRDQIRSNVICPATIATNVCLDHWKQHPRGFEKLKEMYALGRIGQPEEVANYALFLASDEASFITGSVQVIDGGLLAGRRLEGDD
jgi:NAD(P)-dependent dehydrogenase (short-subunit alcohol dehydrogenase family)